jgi:hypothetical protein
LLLLFLIIYFQNYEYVSKYNDETEIVGTVIKITKKNDSVKLIIKAKEKLFATCYNCNFNYEIGSIIKLNGEFKEISENSNFNLFNYKKYLMSLGIYKNFVFTDYQYIDSSNNIIYTAYNKMNEKIENLKSSYFLKAMLLGDTSSFEEDIYANYKINGIVRRKKIELHKKKE